jgi:hypothetical protein
VSELLSEGGAVDNHYSPSLRAMTSIAELAETSGWSVSVSRGRWTTAA